jgi:hypothetical protein
MKPALLLLALLLPGCVSIKEARAMEKVSFYTGKLEGRTEMYEALKDAWKNCGEAAR